jgi:RNA polymerase sigma-70 factor (ECF subfamily)
MPRSSETAQERFESLFCAHYGAVRAYAARRVRPPLVEDVLADTFLVAWRRLDGVPDDPLPWLLGVARRVIANQLRGERRRGELASRLTGGLSGAVADATGEWEAPAALPNALRRALASLSPREREALLLVAWEELDPARAARVAGCSGAAFRVRLHRARRRVARQLAGDTADADADAALQPRVRQDTT